MSFTRVAEVEESDEVALPDNWDDEDRTVVIPHELLVSLMELCKTVESGAYVIVGK
jgi:hypothetical protein